MKEKEFLHFVNNIRTAIGQSKLDAIPPGRLGHPESCLLANSIGVDCIVSYDPDDLTKYRIRELSFSDAIKINKYTGLKTEQKKDGGTIYLPQEVHDYLVNFDTGKLPTRLYQKFGSYPLIDN